MAISSCIKARIENDEMKVTSNSLKKINTLPKFELKKRKIIFCQECLSSQKLEVDLMLVISKAL